MCMPAWAWSTSFPSLVKLDVSHASLQGTLPASTAAGAMPKLQIFNTACNNLTGDLKRGVEHW